MSNLILIMNDLANGSSDTLWEWGALGADGREIAHMGVAHTPEEKQALADQGFTRVRVVIPGSAVRIKHHALDTLSEKQIRQAAGFSVEDELAAPLSQTHLSFSDKADRLAITSTNYMDQLLEECASYGLIPEAINADYDVLPEAGYYEFQGRIIYSTGADNEGLETGWALERDTALHILGDDPVSPIYLSGPAFLQKIASALSQGHMPINLRQGRYAKTNNMGRKQLKRSAVLAALLVAVFLAQSLVGGFNYQRKTKALRSEINTIYTQIFPDQNIPSNPVRAILKARNAHTDAGGDVFVSLSAILANSLQTSEGVKLSSLRFDRARSQLSLSMVYENFDDIENLKNAVQKSGGMFVDGGTRQNGNVLSGDAILRLMP
jgi:type II secretion system protein L